MNKKVLSYGSALLAAVTMSLAAAGSAKAADDARVFCETGISQLITWNDGRISVAGDGINTSTGASVIVCNPKTSSNCVAMLSQLQAAMLAGLKVRIRLPGTAALTTAQCKQIDKTDYTLAFDAMYINLMH